MEDLKKFAKNGNISKNQKDCLIDFLEDHPNLRTGKFDKTFSYRVAAGLWEECSQILNAIPGSTKNWKSWRKVSKILII